MFWMLPIRWIRLLGEKPRLPEGQEKGGGDEEREED